MKLLVNVFSSQIPVCTVYSFVSLEGFLKSLMFSKPLCPESSLPQELQIIRINISIVLEMYASIDSISSILLSQYSLSFDVLFQKYKRRTDAAKRDYLRKLAQYRAKLLSSVLSPIYYCSIYYIIIYCFIYCFG